MEPGRGPRYRFLHTFGSTGTLDRARAIRGVSNAPGPRPRGETHRTMEKPIFRNGRFVAALWLAVAVVTYLALPDGP